MYLVMDPALASIVEFVREMHAPVDAATTVGKQASPLEVAALSGAVGALLDAIDARPDPAPARALQAVA